MSTPLLSIIIVSYNTKALTLRCLESVEQAVVTSDQLTRRTEVIVVDNNSEDDSVKAIRAWKHAPAITLQVIANPTNDGFAAANHLGLQQASGEYIFLLNSDTIVQPGALTSLINQFESHPVSEVTSELASARPQLDRVGIIAANLFNADGSPQPQGGSRPSLLSLISHLWFLDDLPVIGGWLPSTQHTGRNARSIQDKNGLVSQDWVGGTAMMIRRSMIDEVGFLDTAIFMYGEDVEFCLRAQNHHWDVAIDPQAHITHLGSASSSSGNAVIGELKGYVYIWSKLFPLWQLPIVKAIIWIGILLRIIVFGTILRQPEKVRLYKTALSRVFA